MVSRGRRRLGLRRYEQRLIAVQDDKRQKNCDEKPAFHVLRLRMRHRIYTVATQWVATRQASDTLATHRARDRADARLPPCSPNRTGKTGMNP